MQKIVGDDTSAISCLPVVEQTSTIDAIVAGNVCLDIIPAWGSADPNFQKSLVPGSLLKVGPVTLAPGGAVPNTGIALNRLGVPVRLMGKIGDDAFGHIILQSLKAVDPSLTAGMVVTRGEQTSYTVVLNPPDVDRVFLHHSGANDRFGAQDIDANQLRGARLLHFGYPTIMRRLYSDGGIELSQLFQKAKSSGLATSMDMTQIDRNSEAASVDWPALLSRVLPHVDLFLPSVDEILFTLGESSISNDAPDLQTLDRIADRLLAMGSAVVMLKLGGRGLYLRATDNGERLKSVGGKLLGEPRQWAGARITEPSFVVDVAGTTGAGDCAIAGFLAALLRGLGPRDALTASAAAGACCVEKPDATSGVPRWDALQQRIGGGWQRRPPIV